MMQSICSAGHQAWKAISQASPSTRHSKLTSPCNSPRTSCRAPTSLPCLATVEDPDVGPVSISKEKPRRSGVRQFRGSAFLIGLVALPVLWSLPDAAPARQWLELEREWRSADLLRPALIGGS
jgi:hypothetical protein